jgi:hypothetical protein
MWVGLIQSVEGLDGTKGILLPNSLVWGHYFFPAFGLK